MSPKVAKFCEALQSRYHRLAVLPTSHETDEEKLAQRIAESCDATPLNVGLMLSERMMETPVSQRPSQVSVEFQPIADSHPFVILYHLAILFAPELQVSGFRMFLQLSRNVSTVALLACQFNETAIWYAEPGHPEYRQHTVSDFYIITPQQLKVLGWEECDEIS